MNCDEVFEALAHRESDPEKLKTIEAHLAGCAECRTMKEALATYDEAFEHPERFEGDPPHVQKAILDKAHAMAAELRRRNEEGPGRAGPPLRVLPGRSTSLRAPPRLLVAAAVLVLVGAAFVLGRLTAPPRAIVESGPTVGVSPSNVSPTATGR